MRGNSARRFIVLATLESVGDALGILPPGCEGACGWMAVKADSEVEVAEVLRSELAEVGLKLAEYEKVLRISTAADVAEYDPHLAEEVEKWEPGKATVWGTLHPYFGHGEA